MQSDCPCIMGCEGKGVVFASPTLICNVVLKLYPCMFGKDLQTLFIPRYRRIAGDKCTISGIDNNYFLPQTLACPIGGKEKHKLYLYTYRLVLEGLLDGSSYSAFHACHCQVL